MTGCSNLYTQRHSGKKMLVDSWRFCLRPERLAFPKWALHPLLSYFLSSFFYFLNSIFKVSELHNAHKKLKMSIHVHPSICVCLSMYLSMSLYMSVSPCISLFISSTLCIIHPFIHPSVHSFPHPFLYILYQCLRAVIGPMWNICLNYQLPLSQLLLFKRLAHNHTHFQRSVQ